MGSFIGILILISVPFMILYNWRANNADAIRLKKIEEKRKIEFEKEYTDIISTHASVLARKMHQLVYKDDYGDYVFDAFAKELKFYKENKLYPRLSRPPNELESEEIDDRIKEEILKIAEHLDSDVLSLDDISDPLEYERAIAEILSSQGWDARTTKGSGDQGVDVIAVKDGVRLVVQCKLYSSPVGNKAVQEIYSAKQFERADLAAVVTNAGYTKSARQLASSTDVALLSHEDIMNIDALLEDGNGTVVTRA